MLNPKTQPINPSPKNVFLLSQSQKQSEWSILEPITSMQLVMQFVSHGFEAEFKSMQLGKMRIAGVQVLSSGNRCFIRSFNNTLTKGKSLKDLPFVIFSEYFAAIARNRAASSFGHLYTEGLIPYYLQAGQT